jgi:folate-dependent phosphoribosylglycinamide formyltransferase PurN
MAKGVWLALFTQTGSEIKALSSDLGTKPLIFTNNMRSTWVTGLQIFKQAKHDDLMDWLRKAYPIDEYRKNVLITLHGYMRILPPDICSRYNIYNGHPGAIETYPELKGKDPQLRAWNDREKYSIIGSVVHKVVPEVDDGEVVSSVCYTNRVGTEIEMYSKLKQTSYEAWYWFLRNKLCELELLERSQ